MLETMCAELILTGMLKLDSEKINIKDNVHTVYSSNSTYLIPKEGEIGIKECGSKFFAGDLSKDMSLFIKKLN